VPEESVIAEIPLVGPLAGESAATPSRSPAARPRAEASWLCASALDRERMLDMDRRLAPVRSLALGVLALAALLNAHWLGLWTLLPLVAAAGAFALASRLSEHTERPEYVLFGSWVVSELVIAATVVIAGLDSTLLAWLAIPVVTLSARFSGHGVLAGVGVAVGLCVGVALLTDAAAISAYPPLLVGPAAVVIAVGILSTALMRSDTEHRDEAVVDQLTGMLNRNALMRRAFELEEQARLTGDPVGIVVGDLDHFKQVNDTLGHAVGDAVLADVAYAIRKQLRAFDLVYRLGGEEFLVLIPGADSAETAAIAESLRRTIAAQPFAGREVTMTFGVSATERGQGFEYEPQFERADAALYEAKRSGRNRVVTAAVP
jgi:diguanylate cyclase (GGDEF)-like protein